MVSMVFVVLIKVPMIFIMLGKSIKTPLLFCKDNFF